MPPHHLSHVAPFRAQHEDALIIKVMLFQFANSYAARAHAASVLSTPRPRPGSAPPPLPLTLLTHRPSQWFNPSLRRYAALFYIAFVKGIISPEIFDSFGYTVMRRMQ